MKDKEIIHDDFFEALYELAEEIENEQEKNKNDEKHPE